VEETSQTVCCRANAPNYRGIVGTGNPGRLVRNTWWSGGDSNRWPSRRQGSMAQPRKLFARPV